MKTVIHYSPPPWTTGENDDGQFLVVKNLDNKNCEDITPPGLTEANAAHIVKCVNHFEEMEQFIRRCTPTLDAAFNPVPIGEDEETITLGRTELQQLSNFAKTLLDKLEKEEA